MEVPAKGMFGLQGSRARAVYGPSKKRVSKVEQFPYSTLLLKIKKEIEATCTDTAVPRSCRDPQSPLSIPVTFAGTLKDQEVAGAKHLACSRKNDNENSKSKRRQCKGQVFDSHLCNLVCPKMWGFVPWVECVKCLCLFHPVCSGVPDDIDPELLAIFECEACSRYE